MAEALEDSKGKRKAEEDPDEGGSSTKKSRLSKDQASDNEQGNEQVEEESGDSNSSLSSEADGEFRVESDDGEFDSAEDSSDIEEKEEENNTSLLCGNQIDMQSNEDGKYCLIQRPEGKELKIIVPGADIQTAKAAAMECFTNEIIPIFKASGLEISRNDETAVIAYCEGLKTTEEKYNFTNTINVEDKKEENIVQQNSLCIIKLENFDDIFATTDLVEI